MEEFERKLLLVIHIMCLSTRETALRCNSNKTKQYKTKMYYKRTFFFGGGGTYRAPENLKLAGN